MSILPNLLSPSTISIVGVSEFFALYEKDFLQLTEQAGHELDTLTTAWNAAASQHQQQYYSPQASSLDKISSTIQQAGNCLRQMEVDVGSLPSATSSYSNQVRRYRDELANLTSSLRRHQTQLQRSWVLPAANNNNSEQQTNPFAAPSQRERLEEATVSLRESSARLEGSRKLAVETEDLGLSIMGELRDQRNTVIRSSQMAEEANSNIDASGQLLRRMRRRHLVNRLLLYGSIFLLTFAILLIIYVKLTRKS
eukprot:GHVS01090264.1.p1 GENE.GHVS01090264.1~~GHVS01090264.1.p1  ORF type:complete len:253 (+),score=40.51 GHVS01090264.1:53-811(+)